MKTTRYALAGWRASAEAVLLIPLILIVTALDTWSAGFCPGSPAIGVLSIAAILVWAMIPSRAQEHVGLF